MSNNTIYWGSRFGSLDLNKPKPSYNLPWGFIIKVPRGCNNARAGGTGSHARGRNKIRFYYPLSANKKKGH